MSKVFEPSWGNPSLRSMLEAEFPEPISFVPATPGWWLLLAALIGLILRVLWRSRQRYLADSYRREALKELESIKKRLDTGSLEAAREIAPLLRATAIAAVGRETIPSLKGDEYAAALAELSPNQAPLPVAELHSLAYAPLAELKSINLPPLISNVEKWIAQHRGDNA